MPRVHVIKSARKDYPEFGIKKGDTYYKWSLMTGPRSSRTYKSLTKPRPSQLTSSGFLREFYSIQERIEDLDANQFETAEDLESTIQEITGDIESLADETEGNRENMPEGLQEGHVGEMLQTRIDGLRDWASELEGVDLNFDFDEEEPQKEKSEDYQIFAGRHDEWEQRKNETLGDFITEKIEEIQGLEACIE